MPMRGYPKGCHRHRRHHQQQCAAARPRRTRRKPPHSTTEQRAQDQSHRQRRTRAWARQTAGSQRRKAAKQERDRRQASGNSFPAVEHREPLRRGRGEARSTCAEHQGAQRTRPWCGSRERLGLRIRLGAIYGGDGHFRRIAISATRGAISRCGRAQQSLARRLGRGRQACGDSKCHSPHGSLTSSAELDSRFRSERGPPQPMTGRRAGAGALRDARAGARSLPVS